MATEQSVLVGTGRHFRSLGRGAGWSRLCGVVAVLTGFSVACSGHFGGGGSSTVRVQAATDAREAVTDAHLAQPLVFDEGALRLDIARGAPRLVEARAVALFRAGSPPTTLVENVTAVYAAATLRLRVVIGDMVIRPRVVPAFARRPVWAFIWSDGPHSCPRSAPSPDSPEPFHVELIAADGSSEGVTYDTRGSPCGGAPVGPRVSVASYYLSLPWTVVSRESSGVVLRYPTAPPCSETEYIPTGVDKSNATIGVYAFALLARPPCDRPEQVTTAARAVPSDVALVHEPIGLTVGRTTGIDHTFSYFDGDMHTS
jgi:hypothetical protein